MLNLILIVLTINSIINYITKAKATTLNCGNFAWIGSSPDLFNLDKYKILGMMNESRGINSCGVFIDGKVTKGIGATSRFTNLISSESIEKPESIAVVIGHTRNSSVGTVNASNVHPFVFNRNDGSYFVGSHNGTLKNYIDLSEKYNIDRRNFTKIDSEVLLEILSNYDSSKNNNIKVLSEYEGGAAIVFHDSKNPDTMYVFRGESEDSSYSSYGYNYGYNTIPTPERPLFFWQESDDSMYISSMIDSLKMISNQDNSNIKSFETNTLYVIEKGNISKRIKIDRVKSVKYKSAAKNINNSYNRNKPIETVSSFNKNSNNSINRTKNKPELNELQKKSIFYEKVGSVVNEELPSGIVYERLRLRRNGHVIEDGCYVYIEKHGMEFLDKNPVKAAKTLEDYYFYDKPTEQSIELGDCSDCSLIYVVDGLIIKNLMEYSTLIEKGSQLYAYRGNISKMSYMSMYPVCQMYSKKDLKSLKRNILVSNTKAYSNSVLKDSQRFTGSIKPMCSNKTYFFKNGELDSTSFGLEVNNPPSDIKTIDISYILGFSTEDDYESTFENELGLGFPYEDEQKSDLILEAQDHVNYLIDIGSALIDHTDDYLCNATFEFIKGVEQSYEPLKNYLKK